MPFYIGLVFIAFSLPPGIQSLSVVLFLGRCDFLHGYYIDVPCLSICCLEKREEDQPGKTHIFFKRIKWIHFLGALKKTST